MFSFQQFGLNLPLQLVWLIKTQIGPKFQLIVEGLRLASDWSARVNLASDWPMTSLLLVPRLPSYRADLTQPDLVRDGALINVNGELLCAL